MKDLAVIYLAHNRLYYTGITLPRVIDECIASERFKELWVFDDDSQDGTSEFIESIDFDFKYIKKKIGNTVSQINEVLDNTDCKYLYKVDNDILLPQGVFDFMCNFMDGQDNIMSAMLAETGNLPYIEGWKYDICQFTSSLGIHRVSCFEGRIITEKRFFGFQPFQAKMMKRHGYDVVRMGNITNTNLDMSAWSKVNYYTEKGYCRNGLVSNKKSVFKFENNDIHIHPKSNR